TRMANEVLFILLIALGLTYLLALITHSPLENPYSSSNSIGASALNQAGVIGTAANRLQFFGNNQIIIRINHHLKPICH
ncbi:MAG: hypothetical protein HAW58_04515, partial [Candidatus Thioglobus sp.]|nr:hypothetical protein [Candidatus Thioglobus sp.]